MSHNWDLFWNQTLVFYSYFVLSLWYFALFNIFPNQPLTLNVMYFDFTPSCRFKALKRMEKNWNFFCSPAVCTWLQKPIGTQDKEMIKSGIYCCYRLVFWVHLVWKDPELNHLQLQGKIFGVFPSNQLKPLVKREKRWTVSVKTRMTHIRMKQENLFQYYIFVK